MRNLTRHNITVARRPDYEDENNFYYYNIDVFVKPLKISESTYLNDDDLFSAREDIEIYSRIEMPTIIFPENPNGNDYAIRGDYFYWEGKWFLVTQNENYVKMGRQTYYRRYARWDASDSVAANFTTPPPAFQEESDAFLNAVGQTTMVTEMAYLPMINTLEDYLND